MRSIYLFIFIVFFTYNAKAQEIYISSGKNTTNFDYQSSNGTDENLNFRSGTGNYFEVGYAHGLINYKLLYSIGFTYNEYNSKASNLSTNYSWKTKYLGITNKISYNLSKEYSECSHYGSGLRTFLSIGFTYNEYNSKASNYATNYSWKTKYLGITNKISYNLSKEYIECSNYGSGLRTFISVGFNTSRLTSGEQYINNYYYNLFGTEDFSGIIIQPFAGINSQYNISRNFKITMGYNFSKSFALLNDSDEKISFNNHQFQLGFQISILR